MWTISLTAGKIMVGSSDDGRIIANGNLSDLRGEGKSTRTYISHAAESCEKVDVILTRAEAAGRTLTTRQKECE